MLQCFPTWPGRAAAFHSRPCFPPIAFFNCHEGREHGNGGGASLANASEAELASVLYGGEIPVSEPLGPVLFMMPGCCSTVL